MLYLARATLVRGGRLSYITCWYHVIEESEKQGDWKKVTLDWRWYFGVLKWNYLFSLFGSHKWGTQLLQVNGMKNAITQVTYYLNGTIVNLFFYCDIILYWKKVTCYERFSHTFNLEVKIVWKISACHCY